MKILIDMNLSPLWVPHLSIPGFHPIHWSQIGPPWAADTEILRFAAVHGMAILTHDLDFGALLVRRGLDQPSVIQLRAQDVMPALYRRSISKRTACVCCRQCNRIPRRRNCSWSRWESIGST